MNLLKLIVTIALPSLLLTAACRRDDYGEFAQDSPGDMTINLSGQISQEYVTRANDEGFAHGDVMGVYVVDYEGNNPGTLLTNGNHGDNVRHTYDAENYRWNSAYDLYWKDKHTRIDIYGYYPFGSPEDVNAYSFTVKTDQSIVPDDGKMGNYEASDFLWGKVGGVEPTGNVIRLPMYHRMANARVTLVEGDGFGEGEWASLKKKVLVTNTVQTSTIDLSTGVVTPGKEVGVNSIIPAVRGDEWRAIVVPQTIAAGTQLFSISIDGLAYKFSKNEEIEYISGKMNNFSIRVDRKAGEGQYTLTLIGESITAWENDLVSHDATAQEYVVVVNYTPGKLKETITALGKDYETLRNLKITGNINAQDFYFMRDSMTMLEALNLKKVKIEASGSEEADKIPRQAFMSRINNIGKISLIRLILPDNLKSIGEYAFGKCSNLTGSLTIPEGVVSIGCGAFSYCRSLTGSLTLPSTLKYLGVDLLNKEGTIINDASGPLEGAFFGCGFTGVLTIPDNVEVIGGFAFDGCDGFYGNLRLPNKLRKLGKYAFAGCNNIVGSLEIPQSLKDIPEYAFYNCGFNGILTMHDGINTIGQWAYSSCPFRGELILPKDLKVIDDNVFAYCDFSGELNLPSSLIRIGSGAFLRNWRLIGTLKFEEGVISIGDEAFAGCNNLEQLIFPESLENIGEEAFADCFGIGSMVCNGSIPPYIHSSAFNGVAKDNFVLEVPESAIVQYQVAPGWCDFKRIAAHHELVCRPSVACALSTEHKQTLIVDAEGEWEVASKPDWCELSANSGNKKTEVNLTIKAYNATSGNREGNIVFRLKGKDYTHSCHVTQYGYQYGEDEFLTLQRATKGKNGGINIVILGDGYNAEQIASGGYLDDMKQQIEYFFGVEPYTTYRDYFNVYTAFPLSTESGVGTVNTIRYNRFNTTFTGGVGLSCDYDAVFSYVTKAATVTESNLDQLLVIMVPNSTDYGGICQMWDSGAAIAICPKSDYSYPYDSRGVLQHEAGGHGFGKLGDEYIYHNAFIDFCKCACCGHANAVNWAKSLGWYANIELTGKMHEVGWSHLIFDSRYSDIVDIYEGAFMHTRGVYRSEQNSCMNNNIPYYSTISRESIVKRIKRYAGEPYSFEEFVANDKRTAGAVTRGFDFSNSTVRPTGYPPVIHKGSPLKNRRKSVRR